MMRTDFEMTSQSEYCRHKAVRRLQLGFNITEEIHQHEVEFVKKPSDDSLVGPLFCHKTWLILACNSSRREEGYPLILERGTDGSKATQSASLSEWWPGTWMSSVTISYDQLTQMPSCVGVRSINLVR